MIWGEHPLFSETSKCLIVVKPTVTNPTHSVEWATLKTIIFTIHFGGNFPILGNTHIKPTRIGRYISRRLILFSWPKNPGYECQIRSWWGRAQRRRGGCRDYTTYPPWEPKTFIFGGYIPYIEGQKPSFFMVLGSKGSCIERYNQAFFGRSSMK